MQKAQRKVWGKEKPKETRGRRQQGNGSDGKAGEERSRKLFVTTR